MKLLVMVDVKLDWKQIDWLPTDTWERGVVPKLEEAEINIRDLKRSVYVIRLNGDYCIDYPKNQSPTVYIGEGNFKQRISSHRNWTNELKEFVGDFSFDIKIATPRVRKSEYAYLDCEAHLLIRFQEIFGSAPLWNKQIERRSQIHYTYSEKKIKQAICQGRGKKYKWAFKPMKSSSFYQNFVKTHA